MAKSFYDLDYLIELSEKRHEDYAAHYEKVFSSITNIILIYSAIGIFLTTLIQHIIEVDMNGWTYYGSFTVFSILFCISLFYFVRLLIPVGIAYVSPPSIYYNTYRPQMERIFPGTANQQRVDNSLKGSYIMELDAAMSHNFLVFTRKRSFYYNALLFSLLAVLPYLVCFGLHLTKKQENIQKVQLVSSRK
jgi:hypothetical protein